MGACIRHHIFRLTPASRSNSWALSSSAIEWYFSVEMYWFDSYLCNFVLWADLFPRAIPREAPDASTPSGENAGVKTFQCASRMKGYLDLIAAIARERAKPISHAGCRLLVSQFSTVCFKLFSRHKYLSADSAVAVATRQP